MKTDNKNKSRTGRANKSGGKVGAKSVKSDTRTSGKSFGKPAGKSGGKSTASTGGKLTGNAHGKSAGRQEVVVGRIDGNSKGFAFLLSEPDDLFIPRDKLYGARHGDTVKVKVKSGRAEVTEIVARATASIVGTFFDASGRAYVLPDNPHFSDIPVKSGEAKDGDKVVAEFGEDGRGRIVEVLGRAGDPGVDLLSIVRSYGFSEYFPKAVQKNAAEVCKITAEDIQGREDFREEVTFTIDGEDSRDFDDAVSIKRNPAGFVLKVHIADVAHYVTPRSPLDKEAYNRGTSVYFPFATVPMLPDELSADICSLKEGEDRLTLSVIMHLDKLGNVIKHKIVEGVICSKARLTYTQAEAIINQDPATLQKFKHLYNPLKTMHDLCVILLQKRKQRGAINFESDEPKIVMDGDSVVDVRAAERLVSHRLIEEFMVLTNQVVAADFHQMDAPFVYRTHAAPPPEKVQRLQDFLDTLGLRLNYKGDTPKPADFAELLDNCSAELLIAVNQVALRTMTKAEYNPECKGHFGLSLDDYCHFTSPIRRYPDLLIHRIIKAQLHGESLKRFKAVVGEASIHSSKKERLAEEAEREIDDLLTARFMSRFVGQEFDGIVSGITEWGIFVRLANTAEGLVRASSLDGYKTDGLSVAQSGKRIFRPGQALRICLAGVSGSKLEFELID